METCSEDLGGLGYYKEMWKKRSPGNSAAPWPGLRDLENHSAPFRLSQPRHVTNLSYKQTACLQSKNPLFPGPHLFSFSYFRFCFSVSCRGLGICTPQSIAILSSSLFQLYLLLFPFLHPILLCPHPSGNHSHLC